jgi:FkbM family methyltransferase
MLSGCGQPPPTDAAKPEAKAERRSEPPGHRNLLARKKLYSQHDEELIIRDFFQDRRKGFYLDVGCAWPKRNSNTYYLESRLGWSGIGVDALPDYAEAWKRERPKSLFANYIVSDHSGSVETFYRSELQGLSSVKPKRTFSGRELKYERIRIPTITLTKLLDDNRVSKVDLLSIDIEGAELQALAGLDIERFRPELVCIEWYHVGQDRILAYFASHGYEPIERYLARDAVNHYFTPRSNAQAAKPSGGR